MSSNNNPSRTFARGRWNVLVLVLAVLVFAGVGIGFTVNKNNLASNGEQTIGTPVTIYETVRSNKFYVKYEYTVDGTNYTVRGEHKFNNANEAQDIIDAGGTVTVYYDANSPDNALVKD